LSREVKYSNDGKFVVLPAFDCDDRNMELYVQAAESGKHLIFYEDEEHYRVRVNIKKLELAIFMARALQFYEFMRSMKARAYKVR
jgi:hypothetical protein